MFDDIYGIYLFNIEINLECPPPESAALWSGKDYNWYKGA